MNTDQKENRPIAEDISCYLDQVAGVLAKLSADEIAKVIHRIDDARWAKKAVFICGNGGSAATSVHFASDLAKGALTEDKPAIRARSLCENIALLTAWSNDVSYDESFARCVDGWIEPGDVLVAISGSGNSKNVLNVVDAARSAGATTIGLAGFEGGKLKDRVDICVTVANHSMRQIEDVHLVVCHLITDCLLRIPSRVS